MAGLAHRLSPFSPERRRLPAGPAWPATLQLAAWMRRPIPFLRYLSGRFGDPVTLRFPYQGDIVMFSHPDAVKEIFTGPTEVLFAGVANAILEPVVGPRSILLLDGEPHLRERRLLMPPLHGERMHAYGDAMRGLTEEAIFGWPDAEVVETHPAFQRITLGVIIRTVFGVEDAAHQTDLADKLTRLLDLIANPLMLIPPFRINLGPLTTWAEAERLFEQVDEILFAEIRKRKAEAAEGRLGEDVLSLLVSARDDAGEPMTDEELRDEMMTLLAAGHETTATALSWAASRLVRHRDAARRVYEEVDRVFGDQPADPGRLDELDWIDAFCRETLRKSPVIPLVGRTLQAPMRIGGVDMPAGSTAVPAIYLTHHRPDVWPQPRRFDPGRFIDSRPSPYTFFPFGGGIRRCVGMAFALYEMKMVLATLARRFELFGAPGHRTRMVRRSITFAPSDEMPVLLRRRR